METLRYLDLFQKKKINELIDNLDKKDREKLLKLYIDSINIRGQIIRGKKAFETKCWETIARSRLLTDPLTDPTNRPNN